MTQLQHIKVLALDVDGVLTDGTIAIPEMGSNTKLFHVHDGLGISLWQKAGFHVVLISGRNELCVTTRATELNIKHVKQSSKDKISDLETFLQKLKCTSEEVCFVGDDLGDLAVMQHVGYSIAVQNAVEEVKQLADWTTKKCGGDGAVREVVEHLMKANNSWEYCLSSLMQKHSAQ